MVDNLGIMCTAVVVAMIVMVAASRPLTAFVNDHPTVVVLCLSFLLPMIANFAGKRNHRLFY